MITDVFFGDGAEGRLAGAMAAARSGGADLAVLPEIPVNAWAPASKIARDEDAETLAGGRVAMMRRCAREAGVGLVGGAIVIDDGDGKRYNTALVFDKAGELVGTHRKQHLPEEPDYWETSHYEPCGRAIGVIEVDGVTIGVQVCSDINRPMGSHAQAALGARVIINPRATELASYDKWRHVFLATAWTSRAFLVSVNRPSRENIAGIGGPSIAVAPTQEVLAETADRVSIVNLDLDLLESSRSRYPGYLPVRSDLYAEAWGRAEVVEGGRVPG
ncbi:MAG: carbon-nitrogen hydrolase family protein [Phycisphaerales bacterium]